MHTYKPLQLTDAVNTARPRLDDSPLRDLPVVTPSQTRETRAFPKCASVFGLFLVSLFAMAGSQVLAAGRPATFCNPLDLDYRFCLDAPSRREAADPTLIKFKNEFWLFASKSGGYWHSPDLIHWKLIEPTGLPLEDYAPAVEAIGNRLFYTAFNTRAMFSTDDPQRGAWTREPEALPNFPDPAMFRDDDGRVFMYYGCSDNGDLKAVELDPRQGFKVIRGPVSCLPSDYAHHGFEVAGDENRGTTNQNGRVQLSPWTEGAWMTKRKGVYYLSYSTPGTQFKSYADGAYTSTNPMGPFTFASYSPYSHKPTGFIGGAGHSSTVQDHEGRYWHLSTMVISVRHMFERRLGLFPVGFAKDGQIYCNTYLGDYPQFVPDSQKRPEENNSPGWMLLSYAKTASASSALDGFPVANAFDEDIRTWWSAKSGEAGEWLRVDLGKTCRLEALQINFADQGTTNLGKLRNDSYRYTVESSSDGEKWTLCVDRRSNLRDAPHEYVQLDRPIKTRYLRLTNVHMPAGGLFSVSGFRAFGSGLGKAPARVRQITATRDGADARRMMVSWSPAGGADFHIVRYGTSRDRLFNNYQVYGNDRIEINSLNAGVAYYVTVDAINDTGITTGKTVVNVP
jgi:xylan 1,4-beta-xylosidase